MMKCILISIVLLSGVNCARILFFAYLPSVSHQRVFQPIWKELSLRGHEVVAIATDPIRDPSLTNLTEIDISVGYEMFKKFDYSNMTRSAMSPFNLMETFLASFSYALELQMNTTGLQSIMKLDSDYFDLIILEVWNPVVFGIQHKFKAPMIAISTLACLSSYHHIFGNPTHPVLYPDLLSEIGSISSGLSMLQKIDSIYVTTGMWLKYKYNFLPTADREARKYFGDDMPYVEDILKNVSLLFLNVNPIFSDRKPNVPNVIEYHGVHMVKETALTKDLQKILDDAKNGAVYFSLGTNVRFDHIQGNVKETILQALGELPYTVLCKWESEDFPGKPKNVVLRKWFPQQSILAHPNVKVFVTQGGLQSSEEAISNGVPLVVIPFLGDQPMNAKILTGHGMAETILPKELSKDILRDTILKIAKDEKYRLKAQELRSIFLDQPQSGLDKVIWWCEYVIRHKGAKHLRSPGADISLYEYFMLDVLAVVLAALFVTYKVLSLLIRTLLGLLKGNSKSKSEPKKKKH